MMPFLDVSKFSDAELEKKTGDLANRISIAQRTNSQAYQQLLQMMQMLNDERLNRFNKKQGDENPRMKPGLVMTTDENVDAKKEDDDGLINIQ